MVHSTPILRGGAKRLNYIANGKTHQLGLATDKTCSQYSPLVMRINGTNHYIGRSTSGSSSSSYSSLRSINNTTNIITIYGNYHKEISEIQWTPGIIEDYHVKSVLAGYSQDFGTTISTYNKNEGYYYYYSTFSTHYDNIRNPIYSSWYEGSFTYITITITSINSYVTTYIPTSISSSTSTSSHNFV